MAKNTIKLKKYNDIINEYDAGETITPGQLITLDSDGDVIKHATEGGQERMYALEDELQGKSIDDDYDSGDKVQCWNTVAGEEVYAWLDSGNDVSQGDKLESTGDGTLQPLDTGVAIAVALEDLDLSASAAEVSRIKVRII